MSSRDIAFAVGFLLLLIGVLVAFRGFLSGRGQRRASQDEMEIWGAVSRTLLNRASIIAVFIRPDRSISFVSERLLQLTGYKAEEVVGKSWFDVFVAPEVRQEICASLKNLSSIDFPQSSEYLIATRSGDRRLIRWMRMVVRDHDERPVGVVSIGEDLTAAEAREDRIARLKQFYERILENIVNGVFVTDAVGRLSYANASMRELSGILPYELNDDSTSGPLPASLAAFRAAYREARKALQAVPFDDISLKRNHGDERTHSGWMIPLMRNGEFDGMICITEDVTERKLVQEELRANRDMLSEIVTLTADWVWECDRKARYTYASGRVRDVLGYAPEEVIGKTACDLAPLDERANVAQILLPFLETPRAFSGIDVIGLHRNGARVLLEASGTPMYADDGTLAGYRGVVTDITEREAHKRERQRLATAISQAEDIVIIFDREGTIEYVNPAFEIVTGYSRDEAVGRTAQMLLETVEQPGEAIHEMWNTIKSGKTWAGHIVNRRRNGALFHVDVTISPILGNDGSITGFVAVQRDVTEKLELIERLRKAAEMERFGNLVSGVAHEVRNPLNAIQAATAALELDYGDDPEASEMFDIVHSQVDRLAKLMRDLLAIGKPIDQIWLQQKRGADVVSEAVKLWRDEHPEVDAERIRTDLQCEAQVLVDSTRMHQVIVNLLDNALYHGGDGVSIGVTIADEGSDCRISVQDDGRGVKHGDFERVFEPFFTTRRGGTGLGLALAKSVVERHRGRVSLRNNDPHPGCTFEIFLPVHAKEGSLREAATADRR